MQYPIHFVKNVENTWGKAGKQWLAKLPFLIEFFEREWHLHSLEMANNLSFNMVIFAEQSKKNAERINKVTENTENKENDAVNEKVVLKLCPYINKKEFEHEIAVLQFYDGIGTVRLLNYDIEKSAMLLERITPGTTLKELFPNQDKEAVFNASQVIKKLHSIKLDSLQLNKIGLNKENQSLTTIENWLQTLKLDFQEIPPNLMQKSRKLAERLVATQQSPVLLHGDLHHDNILRCRDNWISIDPKGVVGEPAYEVGAFIRNPIPEIFELNNDNFLKLTLERIEQFSNLLHIDKQRLLDWSFVQAILSACWAIEDNSSIWMSMLGVAQSLDSST